MKGSTKTYSGVITVAVLLAFVVGVYSQSSGLPQDGLVNYWKLDGDAKDSAGNLDGDVRGATPVNGLFGQAYKFDEDIDYIFLGNHTAEEDRYTVSLWFKTDSLSWQTLFHRGHTSTCFYNPKIDIQNGRVIVSESDCSTKGRIGGRYYPGIPFKLGEWNHAVITVDGNIAKFYLNGYLQVIDTSQSSPPENLEKGDERVVIGATRTGRPDYFVNSFNGLIDDVAVWNRALPDSDVETIYKQVYPNAKPPAKLDVEYQQVETFPTNKPKFDDKYTGDSSWTVETGQWFVENNILKNANDSAIITLDSVATPGKSIRTKLRQPSGGSKQRYSLIYVGYQDKNNTYYVSLDTLYKTIYIRRAVNGIEDSIGLAVDVFYDKWYDVEVRWLSSTEIQVEIWDENGKSLGVLTRDNMFDSTTSKDWATGKFGFGGIRYPGRIWFDDVRLGTIKNVVQPSPSPTPSPTGSPSPTTSPTPTTTPSPTPSSSSTATPSPTPSMSPSTTPSPTVTPSPSVSTSPKDFELTMTTNTDIIKEGEDVWLTVVGAPSGEEDTTIYLFNFDTAKNGLPTVSNFELVGKSNGGKGSTTKTFTNAGVYTVAVLGVGGLASDNPSNRTARTEHIITVKDVPPKANAGNDITVQQGQKVPFNGGGSYAGDYDETFFYWDVDASDGLSFDPDKEKANLTGQAPQFPPNSYSYSKPGVYTVTLRVFDDDGTFSDDTLQTNVLELTQPTSSPSPTPSPTPTPPPEVSQLKLPLKSNNLDAITRITSLETDFLLSVVGSVYGDLDKQDKKFLTDLPSEIASKGIQKDALVEDVLADVFIKAFEKETDENTQVDIVEAIGLIQSQKTIGFISNILNYKIIGNCASEKVCDMAEEVAVRIGDSGLLQLLDLISFVEETSRAEVFLESVNICDNQATVCQTSQPTLNGNVVEAKIKNLGPDRDFHITTKVLDSVSGQLLVRSTKGDPEKITLKSGESVWIALTDQGHVFSKAQGETVNIKIEVRDFSGYKNIISGSYEVGAKKDLGIPQKYNFTNYGISLINSGETLVESNAIIPILQVDSSIYLESSSNNEIYQNQIVSVGSGDGIVLTDGSPPSNNNKLKSNKVFVKGKDSSAMNLRGSRNVTAINDVLFSSDSYDLNSVRSGEIKLVNVTFRSNRTRFDQDNDFAVSGYLNIVVRDAETGTPINDVDVKMKNNKDQQEVLSEKLSGGQKTGFEVVKKRIRSQKKPLNLKSEDTIIPGQKLSFSESLLFDTTSIDEESLQYTVTVQASGYNTGSATINPDTESVEITLYKLEQQPEDPVDQVPPPPASSAPPSSGSGSIVGTGYSITPIYAAKEVKETAINVKFGRDTIKLSAVEGSVAKVSEVITVENLGNSPATLDFKADGLSLSLTPSKLDLAAKEESQVTLSGELSGLKTGTYTGKIIVTGGEISKEIPIVLVVNPPEHLFDLTLGLVTNNSVLFAGEEIPINTKIVNIAGNKFEAKIKYGLKDFSNNVLFEEDQPVSGEAVAELVKKIKTDPSFVSGSYVIEALLKDQNNENVAVAALTVYINGQAIAKKGGGTYLPIILTIVAIAVVVALVGTAAIKKKGGGGKHAKK